MHGEEERDLTDHQEMYLKVIYNLAKTNKVARVKEISQVLEVSKSSVTNALKQLNKGGFIDYEAYSYVQLTEKGDSVAKLIVDKYTTLKAFFTKTLKLDEEQAHENACRIEHAIDDDAFEKLEQLFKKNKFI